MITFFQEYDTDRILTAPDTYIAPNKGERVKIGDIWYVVVERTFYISEHPYCTIYIKKE